MITLKLRKIIVCINVYTFVFDLTVMDDISIIDAAPVSTAQENKRNVIKWMIDAQYKKDQVIKMLLHFMCYN